MEQRVEQLDKDLRNESKENAELKKKNNDLEKELTEEKEKRRTDGLQLAKQVSFRFLLSSDLLICSYFCLYFCRLRCNSKVGVWT